MTATERRRLRRYVRTTANTLGLHDWTLAFPEEEPDEKEALASVSCVYGRRIAAIWFAAGFELQAPEDQRHVIVHELLHIHLDPIRSFSDASLPALLGAAAWGVFEAGQLERVEHAVDAIAAVLAQALPLPE